MRANLLLNFVLPSVYYTNKISFEAYFLRLPDDYYHYQQLPLSVKKLVYII